MSNGIGRSKENLPTDANHVSAKDRAYQKRMTEKKQRERNPAKIKANQTKGTQIERIKKNKKPKKHLKEFNNIQNKKITKK